MPPPWGAQYPLKKEVPQLKNKPPLKSEAPFQEMIPRKKTQKFHKNMIFSLEEFKIL